MNIKNNDVEFSTTGMSPDWIKKDGKRHLMQELDVFLNGRQANFEIALDVIVPDGVTSLAEVDIDEELPEVKAVYLIKLDDEIGSWMMPVYEDEAPKEVEEIREFFLDGPSKSDWEEIIKNV